MAQQGIPVRTDCSAQYHMHNKFVIVDDQFLITGSFNWTYVAGKHNQENVIVVDNPYYIQKYDQEFEKLWKQFEANTIEEKEKIAVNLIQDHYKKKKNKDHKDHKGQ